MLRKYEIISFLQLKISVQKWFHIFCVLFSVFEIEIGTYVTRDVTHTHSRLYMRYLWLQVTLI